MQGCIVESTDFSAYLGSQINSFNRSTTEIFRRIDITSSVMDRLTNEWRQSRLSLSTKMPLYNALVKSVQLCCAETSRGVRYCSFAGSQTLFQLTPRFVCPLTLATGVGLQADLNGSDRADVLERRGSIGRGSTSGRRQTMHGMLQQSVMREGRHDQQPVMR